MTLFCSGARNHGFAKPGFGGFDGFAETIERNHFENKFETRNPNETNLKKISKPETRTKPIWKICETETWFRLVSVPNLPGEVGRFFQEIVNIQSTATINSLFLNLQQITFHVSSQDLA